MPHTHTESGQYDHTVSAFIIRLDFDEPKIMLHLHKKLASYLQFGGHVELDESPWQAIEHELLEESGYEMSQLKILQPKARIKHLSNNTLHPVPLTYATHDISTIAESKHFHTDTSFVFTANEPPKKSIGDSESQDIILLSFDKLNNLHNTFPYIKETASHILREVLPNWEQVDTAEFKD